MAEPAKAGEQDQSMEEILQSIKRIIAEEGDAPPPAPAAASAAPQAPQQAPFGSDVLELTDMIEDTKPIDPIDAIMAMTTAAPAPEAFTPPPAPEPQPEPAPFMAAPAAAAPLDIDALMSNVAVEASASALRNLAGSVQPGALPPTSSSHVFRSGVTVEDLVMESLRPMLKEWLDANLPQIVDRKVQREIERIARQTV